MNENIGCRIAQRITAALTGHGIPYAELANIIYSEINDVVLEQMIGDWLETPTGAMYTLTWKPSDHRCR